MQIDIFCLKKIIFFYKHLQHRSSFSLISAITYVIATGVLSSVTLGSIKIINNAKVAELVKEMAHYDRANANFVGRYGALPGLLSYSKCMMYPEFSKNCRRQDDINLTTSEYIYQNSSCSTTIGCTLQNGGTKGTQAGEDIFRNFLLPMRYLKDAGLSYVKTIGLSKQFFSNQNSTNNLSKQTWAESNAGDGVYVNIYNYYNTAGFGGYFLFNNNSIMGHTTSSGNSYDHYDKLMNGDNQYLVYHRFGDKRGALAVQNVKALDKKIDDGRPMSGRLTTYSTDNFSGDFKNSEYSKCITAEPSSYEALKNIDYNTDAKTGGGYCNFTYQLENVAEMVNGNVDGALSSSNQAPVATTPIITTRCYFEDKQRCCEKSDGSKECHNYASFVLDGNICKYIYFDNSERTENAVDKISNCISDEQASCTSDDNGDFLCKYCDGAVVAGSCVGKIQKYCESDQDLLSNVCTDVIDANSKFYCSFLNNSKRGCDVYTTSYCDNNNSVEGCSKSISNTSNYLCFILNNQIVPNRCVASEYKFCQNNSGFGCSTQAHNTDKYYCNTIDDRIVPNSCNELHHKYCSSSSGENCNILPQANTTHKCLVLNNLIISESCIQVEKKSQYCKESSNASLVNNVVEFSSSCTDVIEYESKYYCKTIDDAIVECDDDKFMYCSVNSGTMIDDMNDENMNCVNRPYYTDDDDDMTIETIDNFVSKIQFYCKILNGNIMQATCEEPVFMYCEFINGEYNDHKTICDKNATETTDAYKFYCKTLNNTVLVDMCEIRNVEFVYCPKKTSWTHECSLENKDPSTYPYKCRISDRSPEVIARSTCEKV